MEGIQNLFDVEQLAIIDQAEKFATQHLSPAFEGVRAAYKKVKVDMEADARKLGDLAAKARVIRAERDMFQSLYEAESEFVRNGVAAIDTWMNVLSAAIQVALLDQNPIALHVQKIFGNASTKQETYRDAVQTLLGILGRANSGVDAALNLPDGFVAEGQRLWNELRENRDDAAEAEAARMMNTGLLHLHLAEIERMVRRLHAAHRAASLVAGEELPGFDLTILRAAGGGNASGATAAPANGAPLPSLTPITPPTA